MICTLPQTSGSAVKVCSYLQLKKKAHKFIIIAGIVPLTMTELIFASKLNSNVLLMMITAQEKR